jgi:hypothetical protein
VTRARSPRDFGRDPDKGRRLLHLHLSTARDCPRPLELPTPRSLVLVVWDSEDESVEVLSEIAATLIEAGCVHVCVWGSGCERFHDVLHETIVGDGDFDLDAAPTANWHASESLDSALWFALRVAEPDERLAEGCGTVLVLQIGDDPARSAAIARALADPEAHEARVLADEA